MECDLTEYVNTQSIGLMRQCGPVEKQLQVLVVSTQLTLSELKKAQTQSDTPEIVAKQLANLKCSYCIAIKASSYWWPQRYRFYEVVLARCKEALLETSDMRRM